MRIKKNLGQVITTLAVALTITGAMSIKAEAKLNNIKVTSPSGKTVKVAMGKKVKLKAVVKKLKNKKVSFKSSNPKIAKVNAKGFVSGLNDGKTKITVTSKDNPKIKNTIKVVVYKNAVKKIKLNKINVNLNTGEQCKLKAKIKPAKNVSKVLKYTSSNKKVATVTKKGVIKAVAAGTAKITVKATDGSKKKAICNVTVTGKNEAKNEVLEIKNARIRCGHAIDVTLTKAKELIAEDFDVSYKYCESNKNSTIYGIESLNTNDNIHYEICLSGKLIYGTLVNIKINGLDGVSSKTVVVDRNYFDHEIDGNSVDDYVRCLKNGKIQLTYNELENQRCEYLKYSGLAKFEVLNLPEGISVQYSNGKTQFELYGNYNEDADEYKTVVKAVDEKGKVMYMNIHFIVCDDDYYVRFKEPYTGTYLAYKYYSKYEDEYLKGQDVISPSINFSDYGYYGTYYYNFVSYKASGLPENMRMNEENGNLEVIDKAKDVKPGVYNISMLATLEEGQVFAFTYKLTLVEGIIISGKYVDGLGESVPYSSSFYFEKGDVYNTAYGVKTDGEGNYKLRIVPGVYRINGYINPYFKSYENKFTKSQKYDIRSNYFEVRIAVDTIYGMRLTSSVSICDKNGKYRYLSTLAVTDDQGRYKIVLYGYLRKGKYRVIDDYDLNIVSNSSGKMYEIEPCDFVIDGINKVRFKAKEV